MDFFKKNNAEIDLSRLKKVLISDKNFNPEQLIKVLKSDIFNVFNNYCSIINNDVSVSVKVLDNGEYSFKVECTADRLKIFGSLPD